MICECEKCHKKFEANDTIFTIDCDEEVCFDCAEKIALQAKEEDREIEILDQNYNEYAICGWCNSFEEKRGMREERDLGLICEHCILALHSRGEEMWLKY